MLLADRIVWMHEQAGIELENATIDTMTETETSHWETTARKQAVRTLLSTSDVTARGSDWRDVKKPQRSRCDDCNNSLSTSSQQAAECKMDFV